MEGPHLHRQGKNCGALIEHTSSPKPGFSKYHTCSIFWGNRKYSFEPTKINRHENIRQVHQANQHRLYYFHFCFKHSIIFTKCRHQQSRTRCKLIARFNINWQRIACTANVNNTTKCNPNTRKRAACIWQYIKWILLLRWHSMATVIYNS